MIRVPGCVRGAARREILARLRLQSLEARASDVQRLPDPQPSPAEVVAKGELSDEVRRAMAHLTPREALVVRRWYFEGRRLGEIASEVGVSRERARQIRCEALVKLRRVLAATL